MNKKNLTTKELLNKKFSVEISGYKASEVDQYLDYVIADYTSYKEEIKKLKKDKDELQKTIKKLNSTISKNEGTIALLNKKINEG